METGEILTSKEERGGDDKFVRKIYFKWSSINDK
jgi:hypothetical protein